MIPGMNTAIKAAKANAIPNTRTDGSSFRNSQIVSIIMIQLNKHERKTMAIVNVK